MDFISNRDIVVRSKHGHAIEFLKGVPTSVPRVMHSECMEKGILPVDGEDQKTAIVDPAGPKLAPDDADVRSDQVLEVLKQIVKRNNPSDFTGGGHPSCVSISAALGWKVDQKEVTDLWKKHRETLIKEVDTKKKD